MACPSEIAASSLSAREVYGLLTSVITPRPIAWVSTQSVSGVGNLAPFSYFQALCSRPPMVMISVGARRDHKPKDTLANILATGEFVVNHVGLAQAATMEDTAQEIDDSEWSRFDIAKAPALRVKPPRVAQSLACLECKMTHAIPLGQGPNGKASSTVIFGEVVHFFVHPSLVQRDDQGRLLGIEPSQIQSLGRLGGTNYCTSAPGLTASDATHKGQELTKPT